MSAHPRLSPREAQILDLIALGKTTKEIGAELSIAESTVDWHVGNVLTKLGAASRAEAVATALRGAMLDLTEPIPIRAPRRSQRPAPLIVAAVVVFALAYLVGAVTATLPALPSLPPLR